MSADADRRSPVTPNPINTTTSLDSDHPSGQVSGAARGQQLRGNLDENHAQTVGDQKLQSKPRDQILELLERLATPSNRPGSLGRIDTYEILGVVGQGAMGIVLKARDETLQRIVAIKLMSPHLLASPTAKDRFNREARSAAAVSHPNVVTIHAVSEVMGIPYLVMEYIDGKSLDERIRSGLFDAWEVLRIGNQIAQGLSAAHRQGLIHRDIKPSNIMLEETIERVRIADFGLARVAMDRSDLTSDGQIVGTPAYMSPEQVNGEQLDPRSDLFSVGCVMYSMLTGHSPFEARNGLAASRAVISKEPESLHKICDRAPRMLCDLIHRLLRKDPKERFQSADELAAELSRHLRGWNSVADTPTLQLPSVEIRRSTSSGWMVLAIVGLMLAVVAFSIPYFSKPPVSETKPDGPVPIGGSAQSTDPVDDATGNQRITVSKDGKAKFVTVVDALAAAQPGSVIQILDEGPYAGMLGFNDERLRGVRIVGKNTVLVNNSAKPIIQLSKVADVSLEGLVLNVAGQQHGIDITGDCPGLLVQNCTLQIIEPSKPSVSLIYVHHGGSGTADKPILLKDLRLRLGGVGIVFNERDSQQSTGHVRVTGCRFIGSESLRGIPLVLFDNVHDVEVSNNLMETGSGLLSIVLKTKDSVRNFEFASNTCRNYESLFFLNETSQFGQAIRIRNNLLLEIDYLYATPDQIDRVAPWCEGNVWVHQADGQRSLIERVADRRDQIALRSTAATSPDYLVPVDANLRAGRNVARPE